MYTYNTVVLDMFNCATFIVIFSRTKISPLDNASVYLLSAL